MKYPCDCGNIFWGEDQLYVIESIEDVRKNTLHFLELFEAEKPKIKKLSELRNLGNYFHRDIHDGVHGVDYTELYFCYGCPNIYLFPKELHPYVLQFTPASMAPVYGMSKITCQCGRLISRENIDEKSTFYIFYEGDGDEERVDYSYHIAGEIENKYTPSTLTASAMMGEIDAGATKAYQCPQCRWLYWFRNGAENSPQTYRWHEGNDEIPPLEERQKMLEEEKERLRKENEQLDKERKQ